VFSSPLFCGVDIDTDTSKHRLWQHEFGVDAIDGSESLAIPSYFETSEFGSPDGGSPDAGASKMGVQISFIEPDFVQTGDLQLTMYGRANSRSLVRESTPVTFPAPDTPTGVVDDPEAQLVKQRWDARYTRFRWTSNVVGGDYWEGKTLAHFKTTDERFTS